MQARHTDFIPRETLRALAHTRIALIGCGGLGSIIGEGLVRLGARRLLLVDEDRIEITNLDRWQGGRRDRPLISSRVTSASCPALPAAWSVRART